MHFNNEHYFANYLIRGKLVIVYSLQHKKSYKKQLEVNLVYALIDI